MKLARFLWRDRVQWGAIEGDDVRAHKGRRLSPEPRAGRRLCALSDVRLLAPIDTRSSKIVAAAANYGEKAGRDGPGIFTKQPGTVVAHNEPIVYPRICHTVVHEAEVGIVIGRSASKVRPEDALDHVLGYTCVNDVSAPGMTTNDVGRGDSMRLKHFDTFCPVGPWIVTGIDGDNLRIQCRVNGKTDVDGSSSNMLWDVAELVSWVSEVMKLNTGDIIPSGCPGAARIAVGDTVEVEIEGIGTLRNPVVSDA